MPAAINTNQVAQEYTERGSIFSLGCLREQASGACVQRAEDRNALILTGGRDSWLRPDAPPHPAQAGIEMEFALVLEEEDMPVRSTHGFFNAASRSRRARATSRRFCRCLRECLGRL